MKDKLFKDLIKRFEQQYGCGLVNYSKDGNFLTITVRDYCNDRKTEFIFKYNKDKDKLELQTHFTTSGSF